MIDIINSAISYVKKEKEKLNPECPICYESAYAACIPQCGHPICLNCLKGVVGRNNQCPACRSGFYRIIILREKKDGDNLENFLTSNKSWILQAVNE